MGERNKERDLKASIQELSAALEGGLTEHIAPSKLRDFVAGNLPEPERERIGEHLALCRKCAAEALDLTEDPDLIPAPQGELITESELEARWQRFRTAVAPVVPMRRRRKQALAIAAAILLVVLGLLAWELREKAPQADSPVYLAEFYPVVRSASENLTSIPPWARVVALSLNLDPSELAPEYQVKILAEDGREIRSRSGVRPQDDERVVIQVPVRDLPEGTYLIRLSAPQGEPVEYVARIVYADR